MHATVPKINRVEDKIIYPKNCYTICLDEWKNVVHQFLMNVMQFVFTGNVIFGSISMTVHTKDGDNIVIDVKIYIAKVDLKNAIQVCFTQYNAIKKRG